MDNNYNNLPADVKLLIVNAKSLVEDTKNKMKSQPSGMDLTCRLQLRDDCNLIERLIKKIGKKPTQKDVDALGLAITRLQTSSKGILGE